MAEAELLEPVEVQDKVEEEEEWIEKMKAHFGERIKYIPEPDLRRTIRGYYSQEDGEPECIKSVGLFIDAMETDNFDKLFLKEWPDEGIHAEIKKAMPMVVFGTDRQGHPVCFEKIASYDLKKLAELHSDPEKQKLVQEYRLRCYSGMWNKKHNMSQDRKTILYKQINVFDCSNIGVGAANSCKNILKGFIDIESHLFPETVYKMYMVNTGFFFRAVWAIVSLFVHKKTQEKIQILGTDYAKKLLEDIDADQLPKEFGGTNEAEVPWGEWWFKDGKPTAAEFERLSPNPPAEAKEVETQPVDLPPEYDDSNKN